MPAIPLAYSPRRWEGDILRIALKLALTALQMDEGERTSVFVRMVGAAVFFPIVPNARADGGKGTLPAPK